mgnify:CR=1 FL=1
MANIQEGLYEDSSGLSGLFLQFLRLFCWARSYGQVSVPGAPQSFFFYHSLAGQCRVLGRCAKAASELLRLRQVCKKTKRGAASGPTLGESLWCDTNILAIHVHGQHLSLQQISASQKVREGRNWTRQS